MQQCADLRKCFGGSILRSPLSAVTAPGSGDIAITSKSFVIIWRANKNWNSSHKWWGARSVRAAFEPNIENYMCYDYSPTARSENAPYQYSYAMNSRLSGEIPFAISPTCSSGSSAVLGGISPPNLGDEQ